MVVKKSKSTSSKKESSCENCPLNGNKQVEAIIAPGAEIFLLGEAPGYEEEQAGVPFVGAAGRKLEELLRMTGIWSVQCSIGNVLRCRPPDNRDPSAKEMKCCKRFLDEALSEAGPKVVITLGRFALKAIDSTLKLKSCHGTVIEKEHCLLVPMYHPAAMMHQPALQAVIEEDFKMLPEKLRRGPGKILPGRVKEGPGALLLGGRNAIDTEVDPSTGEIVAAAYADERRSKGVTFPVRVETDHAIFHNAKFDLHYVKCNSFDDTILMAHLLNKGRYIGKGSSKSDDPDEALAGLSLRDLSFGELGVNLQTFKRVIGVGKQAKEPAECAIELAEMCTTHAMATWLLSEIMLPQVEESFSWIYHNIDLPLVPILKDIEDLGVMIDVPRLERYRDGLLEKKVAREAVLRRMGVENPHRLAEIRELLYDKLNVPVIKRTDTDLPSTDEDALKQLQKRGYANTFIDVLLKWREVAKEISTYSENWLARLDANSRLHASFNQTGTATGRLSSSKPNLQNVPLGEMRSMLIASPGFVIVKPDWSQLELRLAAIMWQVQSLLEAFKTGDPHNETLIRIERALGKPVADNPKRRRVIAKGCNFAGIYGGGVKVFMEKTGLPYAQAQEVRNAYFEAYPGLLEAVDYNKRVALETGAVFSHFGRMRKIPELQSDDEETRAAGERMAVNMPIQSTAADIVKLAMIQVYPELAQFGARMLLQVHDEIVFEVPEDTPASFLIMLRDALTVATGLDIDLPIEIEIGENWGELHHA